MKLIWTILKDLQDSGQQVTIHGQFSIQHGQFQDVTECNNACVLPDNDPSSTDETINTNRYRTEREQDIMKERDTNSAFLLLTPGLVEVIHAWENLPQSIKIGILSIIKPYNAD